MTSIVDAKECQEDMWIDIPNAFIQTIVEGKKDVLTKIVAPDVYSKFVSHDFHGNKQLFE